MTTIPWTVLTPGMVEKARLEQGRQRMAVYGASTEGLPAEAILFYADSPQDVRAQLAAALDEEVA